MKRTGTPARFFSFCLREVELVAKEFAESFYNSKRWRQCRKAYMHDYKPKLERIVTDVVKDNATYAVRETIRSTVRKALQDMSIQVHLSGLPLSKGEKNAKS